MTGTNHRRRGKHRGRVGQRGWRGKGRTVYPCDPETIRGDGVQRMIVARRSKGKTPLVMALAIIAKIAGAVKGTPEMAVAALRKWTLEEVMVHWREARKPTEGAAEGGTSGEAANVVVEDDSLTGYHVVVDVVRPAAQNEAMVTDRNRFEQLVQERLELHGGSLAAAKQWARRRLAQEEEAVTEERRRQDAYNELVSGYMRQGETRATAEQWAREDMESEDE